MSRALDKDTTASLKATNSTAAYQQISRALTNPVKDSFLEIEILPRSHPVEPGRHVSRYVGGSVGRIAGMGAEEWETYQSMDCGGSSLEGEVLTVSTQPKRKDLVRVIICLMRRSESCSDSPPHH